MIWCACIVLYTRTSILFILDRDKPSFPGGKTEKTDRGPTETAVREFCEEVLDLPKEAPRCQIYAQCPDELITAFRNKSYRVVTLKGPPKSKIPCSNKDSKESKDIVYYCMPASDDLVLYLKARGMLECPLSQFLDIGMRGRETRHVKEIILKTIFSSENLSSTKTNQFSPAKI